MTRFTRHIVVASAALLLAGIASAESWQVDIPFAFRVGSQLMQPGRYSVSVASSNTLETYRLLNTELREGAFVTGRVPHDPNREWQADGQPRLAFQCGDTECTLSELWTGVRDHPSYQFHVPKAPGEHPRLAVITALPAKTE